MSSISQKPIILMLLPRESIKDFFTRFENKYTILSYTFNKEASPSEILADINKKFPKIDAVIGSTDKTSIIASLIATERKCIGPSSLSILKAQDKAICTEIFKNIVPDFPPFCVITSSNLNQCAISFPAFMKPVKGALSKKAYKITRNEELEEHFLTANLNNDPYIIWYQEAFTHIIPENDIHLNSFILQPYLQAPQFTVDAYVFKKNVFIIGITKSVMTPNGMSFARFEHPAVFESGIKTKLHTILEKVVEALDFDNSFFNLEFFVKDNAIIPIEFNTRIAHQFIPLFQAWYNEDIYEQMVRLALGNTLYLTQKSDPLMATSFVLRTTRDKYITYIPTQEEISTFENQYGLLSFIPLGETGKKLSELPQDAYSFRYAIVNIAGHTQEELNEKFELVSKHCPIILQDTFY
jgi:hypothetical protein